MTEKLTEFNPFEFMDTQEEINEFLMECYQDEDPNTFVTAPGQLVKLHGVTGVAEQSGLNRESMYKTFNGKTQPKWDTIVRVLKTLHVNLSFA
ncbi:putative addiction module antidote protein [Colwellia sp. MSW7]|uniref:Addiction module antidote protein n=1 Tax=Colwellia maritima TaxID=2912588 RepID=A0ABS9X5H7_9GAMM|nr:addiction module antidote protein [Colwellia maritima]MCI2285484.1 putative addiction module antidote protein [Colwellia maritima]